MYAYETWKHPFLLSLKLLHLQTHLPFHIKSEAEEQRIVEARFNDIIPVLRRQHGLHGHKTHTYLNVHYSVILHKLFTQHQKKNTYLFGEASPNFFQIIKPRFLQPAKRKRGGGTGVRENGMGGRRALKKQLQSKCWPQSNVYLPCQPPEFEKNPEAPRDIRQRERQGVSHTAHAEIRVIHPNREIYIEKQ